jgi:hypothetical protein
MNCSNLSPHFLKFARVALIVLLDAHRSRELVATFSAGSQFDEEPYSTAYSLMNKRAM